MKNISASYLCSSLGKKQLMALTGLGLCGFVLIHMIGNLLYFIGPAAYNSYSYALTSNHFIYLAEAGLVLMFVAHVIFAILVTIENRKARPIAYAVAPSGEKGGVSFSAKTLIYSGMLIFLFVILHLITFKFGPYYPYNYEGKEMRDLHKLMNEVFVQPKYFVWYTFSMFILFLHLNHALWSSLQTLGLVPIGKQALIKKISTAFAFIVSAGFVMSPVLIFIYLRG